MKEERVLYVFAALLLIILVGVMVPIVGDVNSVPEKIWSTWEKVKHFFGSTFGSAYEWLKNVLHTPNADATILYVTAALVILALILVLIKLIRRRKKLRPTTPEIETIEAETIAAGEDVDLEVEVDPEPVAETKPTAGARSKPLPNQRRTFRVHVTKARRSIADFFTRLANRIFDFISGTFHIILEFVHVVIALLHALVLMAIFSAIVYHSKDWIEKNVGTAFTELKPPAGFQGLWGGLMVFTILLVAITAGFLLLAFAFSLLARAFARIVALGSAPETRTIGRIMAYCVYSLALIMTVIIFSRPAAAVVAVILFVLAPIVGALLRLTLEEGETQ